MGKEQVRTATGLVIEALPNTSFKILLDEDKEEVLAHLSGKMRMYHIKVVVGDKVKIEISPYGKDRGRLVQRL